MILLLINESILQNGSDAQEVGRIGMASEKQKKTQPTGFHVRFNLPGLVLFTVSLVAVTGLLSFALARPAPKTGQAQGSLDLADDKPPQDLPPWGELVAYDTQMERPQEYMAWEIRSTGVATWVFDQKKPEQVRKLLAECGLTGRQVEQALSPQCVSVTPTGTILKPDEALIFSLSPEARARLYMKLARDPANHYMHFPFCFPGKSFDEIAGSGSVQPEYISLVRSLLYRVGDASYLSDFEVVMHRVPSEDQRLALVRVLSSQSAVLIRLRIRPATDIDKLLSYWAWAPGVRFTNLRPLLESLKRLESGSSVSLLYFLPPFARERLYTYPLPAQPGDPVMDCHWSTLNFFNQTPDNRFADPAYIVPYLATNYNQVAKASRYGDLIFLLDEDGQAIHSAVYIADDIVFTKNGNNYMTPWMLMRLKNLLATYSVMGPPRVMAYRARNS